MTLNTEDLPPMSPSMASNGTVSMSMGMGGMATAQESEAKVFYLDACRVVGNAGHKIFGHTHHGVVGEKWTLGRAC